MPQAGFQHSSLGYTATFADTSVSLGSDITGWLWDLGDGNTSTVANPSHTYAAEGSYTVCLTTTNSCGSDSVCQTVVINCPAPQAGFSSDIAGKEVSLEDTSISIGINTWTWDLGNGDTTNFEDSTVTYEEGDYYVCLGISDQCGQDTACDSITIVCPTPSASFTYSGNHLVLDFDPTVTSHAPTTTYDWDFGDGKTANFEEASNIYPSEGDYTACLAIEDRCGVDTTCQNIQLVCPPPTAQFTVDTMSLVVILRDDQSSVTSTGVWIWDLGTDSTATGSPYTHQFTTPGTHELCLRLVDACGRDTLCRDVTLNGVFVGLEEMTLPGDLRVFHQGDHLLIHLPSTVFSNIRYRVINTLGQTWGAGQGIAIEPTMSLPIGGLPGGNYLLLVESDSERYTARFTVHR